MMRRQVLSGGYAGGGCGDRRGCFGVVGEDVGREVQQWVQLEIEFSAGIVTLVSARTSSSGKN